MTMNRFRQRGISTILFAMLLVTGVLFILAQTTDLLKIRATDTAQDQDSTAALMLAESGLQRAQGIVTKSQLNGTMSETVCTTTVPSGAPFSVGRGTITYGVSTAVPSPCASGTCTSCTVEATGTVGSAKRTLQMKFDLGVVYGTTGRGTTVTLALTNTFDTQTIALFNLGWRRQGAGGNASGTQDTPPVTVPASTVLWNVESSSGAPSVGGIGTAVPIANGTASPVETQYLQLSRDYTEVGGLFPSNSPTVYPKVIGSFWSNVNGAHNPQTAQSSGTTGSVNSGFATTDGTACNAADNPSLAGNHNTQQNCFKWCYDPAQDIGSAETLVVGIAARSTTTADSVTTVRLNTTANASYPAQNYPLTQLVHFPDGSISLASGAVYSEIWYAYNQAYSSSDTGAGASVYPSTLVGSAGGTVTLATSLTATSTTFQASAVDGYVCVGDKFFNGSGQAGRMDGLSVTAVPGGGTCSNTTGTTATATYTLSGVPTGSVPSGLKPKTSSSKFVSTGTTGSNLAAGSATLAVGSASSTTTSTVTISASGPTVQGSVNIYGMATTATFTTTSIIYQGTPTSSTVNGTTVWTVYVPPTTALPLGPGSGTDVAGAPYTVDTVLQVFKARGPSLWIPLSANAKVVSVGTNSFTMTNPGATPGFFNVRVCGGVCALFSDPSNITNFTDFAITKSAGTNQWSSGFVCLSGVDRSRIIPIKSSAVKNKTWLEKIQ